MKKKCIWAKNGYITITLKKIHKQCHKSLGAMEKIHHLKLLREAIY